MEKQILLDAIQKHHRPYPRDTDQEHLYNLFGAVVNLALINKFISKTIFEIDKERITGIYYSSFVGLFYVSTSINDSRNEECEEISLTLTETLALLELGGIEDEDMTRTYYIVK